MKSGEYWQKRFDQIEQAANNRSVKYTKQLEKKYQSAVQRIDEQINAWYQRLADNNGVSMTEARKLLSVSELKEFHWSVEDYIKYGQENAIDQRWMKELENASAKFHISRLEALKLEVRQQVEQVFADGQESMYDTLAETYRDTFYRSCYEVQKGIGVGFDVSALDDKQVSRLLSKPWSVDGTNFSEKLWGNKRKLINTLDQELSRMILTGESPQKAVANIRKEMGTSLFAAKRLVLTEQAYFTSVAQKDAYGELDVEEFEVVGTLDSRTCGDCGELDGKHFPLSDMQPGVNAPPMHPFCRCTTCPYFDDEFTIGERIAKDADGEYYEVPEKMTYKEWKEAFAEGGDKERLVLLSDADSESELGTFKKKIIHDEGMKKEYYRVLKDRFSHGSDDAKRVYNKFVPDDSVIDYAYEGTAVFESGKIRMHYGADLNNSRGAGATWFHEHGHMIDDLAGDVSNDSAFVKALNVDFLDILSKKSYSEIEEALVDMRTQSAVSDIFNGVSRDKIKGVATHPLRPDGSSYWTDETIRQEAFAHMFECQFDKLRYAEMKKYFPRALAEFERILKGL